MDKINNVTPSLLWAALGSAFLGDIFKSSNVYLGSDKVPSFFYHIFYWISVVLFFLTVILLIVKAVMAGSKALSDAMEPNNFLSAFLILVYLDYFVNFLNDSYKLKYDSINAYLYIHIILFLIFILIGIYLWGYKEKSMFVPEIVAIAFISDIHSSIIGAWNVMKYGNTHQGWRDLASFYGAFAIYGFWLFIIQICVNVSDIKANLEKTILNLAFFVVLIYHGRADPVSLSSRYEGFIPWVVLLVMVIMYIIKNKMNSSIITLIIAFMGLYHIGVMAFSPDTIFVKRSVYEVFTLIGLYFGFVLGILNVILYFVAIIKGEKSA